MEYVWKHRKGPREWYADVSIYLSILNVFLVVYLFLLNRYVMPLGFIVNIVGTTDLNF